MKALRIVLTLIGTLTFCVSQVPAQNVIGSDDFDAGGVYLTRTFNPNNSANDPPGTFPNNNRSVFGIVDRNVHPDFADDTLVDPKLTGMVPSTKTDRFFGAQDLLNSDNQTGNATLTYTFNVCERSVNYT